MNRRSFLAAMFGVIAVPVSARPANRPMLSINPMPTIIASIAQPTLKQRGYWVEGTKVNFHRSKTTVVNGHVLKGVDR